MAALRMSTLPSRLLDWTAEFAAVPKRQPSLPDCVIDGELRTASPHASKLKWPRVEGGRAALRACRRGSMMRTVLI